jgi:hypothetical protein
MAHTSIWIPGTIIQVESPERLAHLSRKGWGAFFRQEEGFNWFHLPVTTPWTLDDHHLALTTVFVFYRAIDGPQITNIHLYSGPKRLHAFDGLHAAGENTVMKDGAMNMWDLPSPVFVDSGLGISVGVDFKVGGEILFTGAGGYFQTEEQS